MSSIIKHTFVSLLDQKKTIEVVNINNDKIINNKENENPENENPENENQEKIIDNNYEFDKEEDISDSTTYIDANEDEINNILEDAYKQAEEIIEKAKKDADSINKEANARGYEEGYNNGKREAQKELLELKQQLEDDLKPKISEIIQTLVTNMIGIQKFEKEVILFLIKVGLEEIDLNNDIVIKVSQDDYDEVINNINFFTDNLSEKISFEVLQDNKLNKNDCIIETSLGIIDCGLQTRMEGLLRHLQLIEKSF